MASDLIRKSRTLELLKYYERQYDGIGRAIRAFEQMETVDRWIPCSERMPKEDGNYLISGVWGSGKEAVGDCDFSVNDGYFRTAWNFDVLAWMPLPSPWEGE
jgi:hypothetical protein